MMHIKVRIDIEINDRTRFVNGISPFYLLKEVFLTYSFVKQFLRIFGSENGNQNRTCRYHLTQINIGQGMFLPIREHDRFEMISSSRKKLQTSLGISPNGSGKSGWRAEIIEKMTSPDGGGKIEVKNKQGNN